MLAIEVLMQAVVVAGPVSQQQRRRPRLPRLMAAAEERLVRVREARRDLHRLMPAIGDRRQPRVERGAQVRDDRRQGIAEILVLAAPETVARHDDAAAEAAL